MRGEYSYHAEAGYRQTIATTGSFVAAQVMQQAVEMLDDGVDVLLDRDFCDGCPAAVICAAAGVVMEKEAPSLNREASLATRDLALETAQSFGIGSTGEFKDLCFGNVIGSIESGVTMQASKSQSDPLQPGTFHWLADRAGQYAHHVVQRLNSGQRR